VRATRTFLYHQKTLATTPAAARTTHLGELAIQETMNDFALDLPKDQRARLPVVSGAARLACVGGGG